MIGVSRNRDGSTSYTASVRDIPGAMVEADSEGEAVSQLAGVFPFLVSTLEAQGVEIPAPDRARVSLAQIHFVRLDPSQLLATSEPPVVLA